MVKMNAEKFRTLSLLAMVVIAVVLISGCAGPEAKTGPGGISVPSGFTEHKVPFLGLFPDMEGVTVTAYIGSGTAEDALSVFRASAIDAGWTRMGGEFEIPAAGITAVEMEGNVSAGAEFEKGDEWLLVNIVQAENQIMVMVIIAPKDIQQAPVEEAIPEQIGPPTSDVAGEDISDVPRYPGSVRTGSLRTKWAMSVEYITSASLDEVLAFYEKELPAYGWTDISGRLQIDEATITIGFGKGDRQLMIQSSRSEDYSEWGPNYTSVFIFETIPE